MVIFFDGELISDQELVISGIIKVNQADKLFLCITISVGFGIDLFGQQAMKGQTACHQIRCADLHHLFQNFLVFLLTEVWT